MVGRVLEHDPRDADKLQTMTDKSLELAVRGQITIADLMRRTRERLAPENGQTAAEYIGIVLVIVAVVAAIAASGIGKTITSAINDAVDDVERPKK
jgi:Flp pilus assembly pilin Flp